MGTSRYNWSAAFVAYCQNHPFEEISEVFGIPLEALEQKSSADRWQALRAELPLATNAGLTITPGASRQPGETAALVPRDPFNSGPMAVQQPPTLSLALKAKLDLLTNNRKQNYEQADKLRAHMDTLLARLGENGLKLEQLYHNKGNVVRTTRDLGPADLVNLATFMRLYQEMTYRALGDTSATEKGSTQQDNPAGTQAPAIIINLPGVIAQPRELRNLQQVAGQAGAKVVQLPPAEVTMETEDKIEGGAI